MRRRDFITLLGGAAVLPIAAQAQQGERVRRIGILMNLAESDPEGQARLARFVKRLMELGWADGRNAQFDIRWASDDVQRYRRYATELAALTPDVILAAASPAVTALVQASRAVPIVFVAVVDPVGAGFVESMARPGGNTTGFTAFEYSIGAKWLELLREIAPTVTRAAVLRDPSIAAGIGQFAAIQAVGSIGIELSAIDQRDAEAIERAITTFARRSNGGLVVTTSPFGANHPDVIAALAARYKLPAVYPFRYFVSAGGLISYGSDTRSDFHAAANYVDRILKGEKPADLPVQAPTKYELVINLKAAKALGLEVPSMLLTRADEVIE
jgi:putative tryptophan/tyrosine transport system substrate-binding protein